MAKTTMIKEEKAEFDEVTFGCLSASVGMKLAGVEAAVKLAAPGLVEKHGPMSVRYSLRRLNGAHRAWYVGGAWKRKPTRKAEKRAPAAVRAASAAKVAMAGASKRAGRAGKAGAL